MVAIGTSSVDRLARSKRPIVERTEIHIPPAPQLSSEAVTGPTANRLSAVSRFNTDLQKWRNDAWAVEMPGQPDFALQADVATLRADTKAMIANIATNTLNITNIKTDITNLTTAITEIDNSITTINNQITIIEGNAITGTGIVQANGANPPTAILGTPGHVPYWTSVGPPYISLTSPIYTDGTSVGIGTDLPAVLLDVGLAGTTPGVMRLAGGTSGNVTIQTAAAAGAWTLTLPVNDGAANEFLKTNGAGVTSWSSVVLTTDVFGVLPVANGGTNAGSWTAGSVIFAGAGGTSLAEDNANLFYDDAQNRFGVGTNAPVTPLHIAKDANVLGSTFGNSQVKISGSTDLAKAMFIGMDTTVNKGFIASFSAAWVDLIINLPGGNVGIGIAAPIEKFEVGGVVSPRMSVKSNAINGDMGVLFQTSDLSRMGAVTYNHGVGNALEFRTSGTNAAATRAVLTTNLSIGLGAVAGSSRLHVNIDDAVATVTDVLRLNHSLNTGGTAANFGTGILLTGETSTTDAQDMARIQTIWTDSTHATRTSALQFQTVNSAAALATRVTILGSGFVGIGIVGPTSRLHVPWISGDAVATSEFGSNNASNNQVAVDAYSSSSTGVRGNSATGAGVAGISSSGTAGTFYVNATPTTNAVIDVVTLRAATTGLAAANFGTGLKFITETDANDNRDSARIQALWTNVTDATRTSAIQFQTVNSAAALSTRMWITPVGVGIGTGATAPGALLDLGLSGTTLGVMRLAGSTSGNVTIQPQAVAGTWTLQLPQNDGALGEFLTTDGAGITSWSAGASVTPSALTKTDDTNITLTLGGSPTVALLAATSLTLGWTGELSIARGGTGSSTASANNIPFVASDGLSLVMNSSSLQWLGGPTGLSLLSPGGLNAWVPLSMDKSDFGATDVIQFKFLLAGTDAVSTASYWHVGKEQNWTGVAGTRDSYISIETVLDNVTGQALGLRSSGSVVCGKDATATTRVNDFTYICTSNGPPTGVPTGFGNRVPITFDPNTDTFYIYRGGWKGVVVL